MTDAQLFGLFTGFNRGQSGEPLVDAADEVDEPTDREVYVAHLRSAGITDRAVQEKLWRIQRDRRASNR